MVVASIDCSLNIAIKCISIDPCLGIGRFRIGAHRSQGQTVDWVLGGQGLVGASLLGLAVGTPPMQSPSVPLASDAAPLPSIYAHLAMPPRPNRLSRWPSPPTHPSFSLHCAGLRCYSQTPSPPFASGT